MILKNKKTREFSRVFLISNSEFQISNLILLLVLHIAGEALPKIFLRDKEFLDCEECGDTNNANDIADPVGVIDNNVSCDSEGKNLEGVRRSKVDQHAYELKADYDGEYVVQEMCGVVKITVDGEDMIYLLEDHVSHCAESDYGNDDFHDLDYDM